jgi:hypothetical protein
MELLDVNENREEEDDGSDLDEAKYVNISSINFNYSMCLTVILLLSLLPTLL